MDFIESSYTLSNDAESNGEDAKFLWGYVKKAPEKNKREISLT
jgi:hypothetical protein